jgi:ankyrin repeat protein
MAASSAAGTSNTKVWIPVDVKTHWFGFLGVPDLCNCLRVCKAWTSLITKTADAEIATITAATPPSLGRSGKLKFLHRLHYAHQADNLGYLLSWAAGNRGSLYLPLHRSYTLHHIWHGYYAEYTPFLHKLLLLRDCIREDLGLPGGLHEPARPEAYDELEESLRALWTYKYNAPVSHGVGLQPTATVEVVTLPPLVVAASRGNIDALSLLLLFGEGVHPRRKGNDKALYAAVEQGNVSCVAALLGRLELHPPKHPPHLAKRLGLVRPSWNVFGPGMVYSAGVSVGPQNVAATVASTKIRAELAAASGIATDQGTKALASAAAARTRAAALQASVAAASITPIEAMVAQQEIFEHDGRYRHWCNGLHMGTYWFLYDSAISNYEAIHGPIGVEPLSKDAPPNARPGTAGTQDLRPAALLAITSPAARASFAARRMTISIFNLQERLNGRVACGSIGPLVSLKKRKESVTAGYAAQALLASRLPPNGLLPLVSQPRRRGYIHPCLPEPVHYGRIASDAIALKIRVNIGPQEGRTPLLAACERGRVEIAYLLLSHFNIKQALSAEIPELPRRPQEEESNTPAHQNAAPQPGGAPQMVAAVAPPPPVISAPSNPFRAALYAVASAKGSALAVASETAMGHEARRQEVLIELLQEERDRSDVDLAPAGHHTPLCLACDRGDERLVALLLHWGADVNREGRKEARPLLVAIMAGKDANPAVSSVTYDLHSMICLLQVMSMLLSCYYAPQLRTNWRRLLHKL